MMTQKETKFYNALLDRFDEVQHIPLDDLPYSLDFLSWKVKARFSAVGSVEDFLQRFPDTFYISQRGNVLLTKNVTKPFQNEDRSNQFGTSLSGYDSSTSSGASSVDHDHENVMTQKETKFYNALLDRFDEVQHIPLDDLPYCLHLSWKVNRRFSADGSVEDFLQRFPDTFYISQRGNVLLTKNVTKPFQNRDSADQDGTSLSDYDSSASSSASSIDRDHENVMTQKETKFYNALMDRFDVVQHIPLDDLPYCLGLSWKVNARFSADGSVEDFLQRFPDTFYISQRGNVLLTKNVTKPFQNGEAASKFGNSLSTYDSSVSSGSNARYGSSSGSSVDHEVLHSKSYSDLHEENFFRALQQALEKTESIHLERLPHCLNELDSRARAQFLSECEVKAFITRHSDTFHLSQCNHVLLKTHILPSPPPKMHCEFEYDIDIMMHSLGAPVFGNEPTDADSEAELSGVGVVIHWKNNSGFINSFTVPRKKVYFNSMHLTDRSCNPCRGDLVYFMSVESGLAGRSAKWNATSVTLMDTSGNNPGDADQYNTSSSVETAGLMQGLTGLYLPLDDDYGYILHGNDIVLLPDHCQQSLPKTVTPGRQVHFDAVYVRERPDSATGRILMVRSAWVGTKPVVAF